MSHKKINFKQWVLISLFSAFLGLLLYAPYFLTYRDIPRKSDVVMILDGPGYINRRNEAVFLFQKGYSKYTIIPGQNIILTKTMDGIQVSLNTDIDKIKNILKKPHFSFENKFITERSFYEGTYQELIMAKLIMEGTNLSSAIFVSNPYHMRRVKIIASCIFSESGFTLHFVPTRYEKINKTLWWAHKNDRKWVLSESIKIVWFFWHNYIPF